MTKIFIDPGHGGDDPGAISNGIREADVTLAIAKKIGALLAAYNNIEVILSRNEDVTMSLGARTRLANLERADVLVSVHINSSVEPTASGFETFIHPNANQTSVELQNVMHKEIMKAIDTNIIDRGKKRANFHMLRESNMPAILTENLFISNEQDAELLKQDSFLDKIAQGHVNGLMLFLRMNQ